MWLCCPLIAEKLHTGPSHSKVFKRRNSRGSFPESVVQSAFFSLSIIEDGKEEMVMLTLLDFQWPWNFMIFDPESLNYEIFNNDIWDGETDCPPDNWTGKCHGFYSIKPDESAYMLYSYNGIYYFGDNGFVIALGENVSSRYYQSDTMCLFKLYSRKNCIYEGQEEAFSSMHTSEIASYQAEYTNQLFDFITYVPYSGYHRDLFSYIDSIIRRL
jgi:hypothetical protein